MNPGSPNHDHSLIDHHNWGNFHQVNYINNIITTHRFLNKEIKKEMRIKHEKYEGSLRRAEKSN